jgi:D-alanyl-D-alanine dipeptidase
MKRQPYFQIFAAVAVLSVILNIASFAQDAGAVAESPRAGTVSAQQVFRITPVRPIAKLRAEALKATPPEDKDAVLSRSLVDLTKMDSTIHFDIRYATSNNFLGEPVYGQARAFLQRPAALALQQVNKKLLPKGYGLLVYDAYRPWYVTKIFWDATPVDKHEFVADPAKGSRHNRGCAVDLTLYEVKTGEPVAMPSGYDEMSPRAYADYKGASAEEKKHREILREAMESEGFLQMPNEWWHYDYKEWKSFGILNMEFPPLSAADANVKAPIRLSGSDPEFSDEAFKLRKFEGTVPLGFVVDEKGRVQDVRVLKGLGHGLDEKAMEAVQRWTFKPGMKDGHAVRTHIRAEVNFNKY